MTTRPWWQVAVPHKDIREGRMNEAVFAANLGDVVLGRGPKDYLDPNVFFEKTYLTVGLKNLLTGVLLTIAGTGKGESVIQLQTPFGGGKTHALLVLYHFFKNPEKVSKFPALREITTKTKVVPHTNVAAFVGTYADPLKGKTIWGQIAEQLGAYELVREHDKRRVSPGKAVIDDMLRAKSPCLILIDELLEYVVKAAGVRIEEGTLKGQVLSFLQELTEAMASIDQAALVLTLPSSNIEQFDEAAVETLMQLQKISGRVETIYTPVSGEEVYEVIRKRLFDELGDTRAHTEAADEYYELYRTLGDEVPKECREAQYKHKIQKAYPFHPELIDVLFERWSTISTFQRTRGALRFLAEVISDLYKKEHPAPLIQPAHIDLSNQFIRRELLKHLESGFDGVVSSDIDGPNAKSPRIDREMGSEYSRYKVATGLATSMFFYSFSGSERKGITPQRLRLAFLREGIPPSIVGDAAKRLTEELWFLHSDKSLYYFLTQANLNRVIIDKEESVEDDHIQDEIKRRLERLAGSELEVYVWPKSPNDIPDSKRLKLAIISPNFASRSKGTDQFVNELLAKQSSGFRTYRNTLLALILDSSEYDALNKITRRCIALWLIRENRDLMKTFSEENKSSLEQKYRDNDQGVTLRLMLAYRYVAKASKEGTVKKDMGIPTLGDRPNLSRKTLEYLQDQEMILQKISPKVVLDRALSQSEREKPIAEIQDAFSRFAELPILKNDQVLKNAIEQGVRTRTFGVKVGDKMYFGVPLPDIAYSDGAVLLRPEVAMESELTPGASKSQPEEMKGKWAGEKPGGTTLAPKHLRIRMKVPWDKISSLVGGVVTPLSREGADITLEVNLTAFSEKGIGKDVIDLKIKETLNQIGAEILEIEEE